MSAYGSDWSAGPINPLYGLLVAGTRVNYKGETDWGPDEAVDVEDAIRHYTINSAEALLMDEDIGSIEVGKYADMALFSIDLRDSNKWWFPLAYELEAGKLDEFVKMTIVDGRVVYQKPETKS